MKLQVRPVLWALTAVALVVLLSLGTWQVRRLQWKTDLIAKVETRLGAPPVSVADIRAAIDAGEDVEYRPVAAVGGFPNERIAHVFGTYDGEPGYYAFQAMRLDRQPDGTRPFLLVNRGFVPQGEVQEYYSLPSANQLSGLVRFYSPAGGVAAAFTPEARTEEGFFFERDPEALARYLFESEADAFLPFAVDSTMNTELPRGDTTRIDFRNAHLGYAITWYGLAAGLLGVVFVMSRKKAG